MLGTEITAKISVLEKELIDKKKLLNYKIQDSVVNRDEIQSLTFEISRIDFNIQNLIKELKKSKKNN